MVLIKKLEIEIQELFKQKEYSKVIFEITSETEEKDRSAFLCNLLGLSRIAGQNRKNKEWWGTIIRTDLTDAGDALTTKQVWDANDKIKIHYVLSFYECTYISGQPQFGDDVVAAKWHQISKINERRFTKSSSKKNELL